MQEQGKIQEIEELGEAQEWEEEKGQGERGGSVIPLIQAAICALLLATLVFLKMADPQKYEIVSNWYQEESSREIQLPTWEREAGEEASSSAGAAVKGASLQKI